MLHSKFLVRMPKIKLFFRFSVINLNLAITNINRNVYCDTITAKKKKKLATGKKHKPKMRFGSESNEN